MYLIGVLWSVTHSNMGNEDSHDANIESKGDGALDINEGCTYYWILALK
jgi:hypothetical protein